jgi:hypothetical protein
MGAHRAALPEVELTITAEDPLAAAKELVLQLETALEKQRAEGNVSSLLAEHARRVTSYIKQRKRESEHQRRLQEQQEDLARWRHQRDEERSARVEETQIPEATTPPGGEVTSPAAEIQPPEQQELTLDINLRHPEVTINQAATSRPTTPIATAENRRSNDEANRKRCLLEQLRREVRSMGIPRGGASIWQDIDKLEAEVGHLPLPAPKPPADYQHGHLRAQLRAAQQANAEHPSPERRREIRWLKEALMDM